MESKHKQLIVGIVTAVLWILGCFFLSRSFKEEAGFYESALATGVAIIYFGILFSFAALLIKKAIYFFGLAIIFAASFALPVLVFEQKSGLVYFGIAVVIFLACMIFAYYRIQAKNRFLRFRFFYKIKQGLPVFLTGLSVALAVVFAISPLVFGKPFNIPKPLFDKTFQLTEALILSHFSNYRPQMTVDEFLMMNAPLEVTAENIKNNLVPVKMVEQKKKEIQTKFLEEQKQKLSEAVGIKINGPEKLKDVLYQVFNAKFTALLQPYQSYMPLMLAIFGFLTIKSLTWILGWVILGFGWIIFKILLNIGFILLKTETVEKEILSL